MTNDSFKIIFSEAKFLEFMQSFRLEKVNDELITTIDDNESNDMFTASPEKAFNINHKSLIEEMDFSNPIHEVAFHVFKQQIMNKYNVDMPSKFIETDAENLRSMYEMVYGENENKRESLYSFRLSEEILLPNFVGISSLTRLFSERYMHYEWNMHTEIKATADNEFDWSYYRDHMTHQVRNAFTAIELLDKLTVRYENRQDGAATDVKPISLIKTMSELLSGQVSYGDGGATHISSYFIESVRRAVDDIRSNLPLFKVYDDLLKVVYKSTNNKSIKVINERKYNVFLNDRLSQHFSEYIIRASLVMAALFHDFGYPIEYTRQQSQMLGKLIDSAHYFISESHRFDEIYSLLSDSILCRLVGKDEIRKVFLETNSGVTHGCLSALAFLLFFYESGQIHGLPAEQRAAVELAAVIIYDHTLWYPSMPKYSGDDSVPKLQYIKPSNVHNPLSYFFRFCDDIQEWERLYFKLSDNENLRICSDCHLPIVSFVPEYSHVSNSEAENKRDRKIRKFLKENPAYICECVRRTHPSLKEVTKALFDVASAANSKETNWSNMLEHIGKTVIASDIEFRRINIVNACKTVEFIPLQDQFGSVKMEILNNSIFLPESVKAKMIPVDGMKRSHAHYLLHINYNHYKMLQMAIIDPNFAFFRMKEINENLKPLLERQLSFPDILVYTVASMNPITLKVRIIERFLLMNDISIRELKSMPEPDINRIIKYIMKPASLNMNSRNFNIFYACIKIYLNLLCKSYEIHSTNQTDHVLLGKKPITSNEFKTEIEQLDVSIIDAQRPGLIESYRNKFGNALDMLIQEFFKDECKMIGYTETIEPGIKSGLPSKYYEQYWDKNSAKRIRTVVSTYCRSTNYVYSLYNEVEVENNSFKYIHTLDVHSDLTIFHALDRWITLEEEKLTLPDEGQQ
ncbi:MAG: hypothetical protein FWG88_10040 [Oscillospiraceae bacterium]|nr:hypothetical protein [Oscillospiraceae bacterium]